MKILFISHNSGRTGAPLMLLSLLKWFKENTDLSIEILLRETGPLRPEFEILAPTTLYQNNRSSRHLRNLFARKFGLMDRIDTRHRRYILQQFRDTDLGLIYSNTITNGDILETLAPLKCPVLTHVHELNNWIEKSGQKNLEQVKRYTSSFIAASAAVKNNLVSKYTFPPDKINVVHSFIPLSEKTLDQENIRQQLGIPQEAFVVLGSGYEIWRKGKDLFVQLAAQVQKICSEREIHFLWVGGKQEGEEHRNILHDVHHLNVSECVHFVGQIDNPLDYFSAGDVFAMVSREDPFPLVSLEAAELGKPVLCFADAGGMVEFVEQDAGFLVPYLDLQEMAKRIVVLSKDHALVNQMGECASQKVKKFFNVDVGSKKILNIIEGYLR